jgi:hypothetical protein
MSATVPSPLRSTAFLRAVVLLVLSAVTACSSWQTVEVRHGWTLYGEPGVQVDARAFGAAFDPAFRCVEEELGPFHGTVRVHAVKETDESPARLGEMGASSDVPGIGRARISAWHAHSTGWFGPRDGIYAREPEVGTAVHELVHARFAEEDVALPLWLEEGIACLFGDGFFDGERWVVDGFACWPVHLLREQTLSDEELARVLRLSATDSSSARDNFLVHFVGWAIVFDLYRDTEHVDWGAWARQYASIDLAEARRRLESATSPAVEQKWLEHLSSPDPARRLAAAKGSWKLQSTNALTMVLDALEREEDPEVRVGLAVNALAAAGESRLPRELRERVWGAVWPVMRRGKLADPAENAALRDLYQSYRRRTDAGEKSAEQSLQGLRRFWAE